MKKIKKYVVFKYEDEFGFHYMVMDKLPGEEPTHPETLSFKKKIPPQLYSGSYHSSAVFGGRQIGLCARSKFVPVVGWWPHNGDVLEWRERARVYRATKELEKKWKELEFEKAIEPIREAYSRLSPSGRSTFIAQMVYLLTK